MIENRQDAMKAQGKDMGAVKAFIDGKGDLAAAQAARRRSGQARHGQIPTLFPKGTGMAEFPGKSCAKPAIWTEWDKFTAAAKTAAEKAAALDTALEGRRQGQRSPPPSATWARMAAAAATTRSARRSRRKAAHRSGGRWMSTPPSLRPVNLFGVGGHRVDMTVSSWPDLDGASLIRFGRAAWPWP